MTTSTVTRTDHPVGDQCPVLQITDEYLFHHFSLMHTNYGTYIFQDGRGAYSVIPDWVMKEIVEWVQGQ